MGPIQRRVLRGVLRVVAYPRLTLAVAGVVLLACAALALSRLSISTDQNKLYSADAPFFRNYLSFIEKFPENEAIYVVVEAAEPGRVPPVRCWTELADRITERLRGMPQYVLSADSRVPLEELGAQALLFEDPGRLPQTVEGAWQLAALWGEKPNLLTGLLGRTPMERFLSGVAVSPPDQRTIHFVGVLAESWNKTLAAPGEKLRVGQELPDLAELDATDPSRLGYYYVPDDTDPSRYLLLVRVYHRQDFTSLTAISQTVEAIRKAVNDAARPFPEFKVGVTGRPALEADEMRTTDRDTRWAEIVALGVVFVGLVLMMRSVWLALAAEMSLVVGIGWTFGWATVSVGELNLLSVVFMIALIGIGMDYLIQILAAYRREARRYVRPKAIWARVFRYVGPPITTACMGAAGAFLVSLLTDFRGAAELGIIAGVGLLLCLLAGYTVLPALLVLWPPRLKPWDASGRYGRPPQRVGARRLILPAVFVVVLVAGIPFAMKTGFNPNLLELQAANLESVKLVRKLQTWSAVVLSRDLEMLRKVRQAVDGAPTVASTESILSAYDNYEWLQQHKQIMRPIDWTAPPPVGEEDLPRLAQKARILAERFAAAPGVSSEERTRAAEALRRFAAALEDNSSGRRREAAEALSRWQAGFVDELREMIAQFSPPPPDVGKLPAALRSHLVSEDGYFALYIYPKEDLWKREALAPFVEDVEQRVGSVPGSPPVTGIASNVYHSTGAIEGSFYRATAYALGLIFVLVLIDMRRIRQTLVAVSVLAFGLPMLVALMGLFGIDWNFANFFGLPILIGAGHEYGVFMVHRYREVLHDPKRVWGRWDVADRALLLCAFVTSSSFAFFWLLGHHEGLKSLGLVMALGSACIYLASLVVVRPMLLWWIERKNLYARVEQGCVERP